MRIIKVFSAIVFCLSLNVSFSQTTLSLDSVENYTGYEIKVCEKVTEVVVSTHPNKITYVNFGGYYPDHKLAVIIFPKDLVNFDYVPHEFLKDKNICVIGTSSEYKGKPQIVVTHPDQIEVVE